MIIDTKLKNLSIKSKSLGKLDRLNYIPNEYASIYPNTEVDKEIIAILQDKPSTFLQLKPFFLKREGVLWTRLIDLCLKGVLRKVYNGNLYYQLKRERIIIKKPQIIIKKDLSESVYNLSSSRSNLKIPKGYSFRDYQRERLDIIIPSNLKFIDGKFRNPKLLD